MIPGRQAVVVDTNVFGAPLTRRHGTLVTLYAPHLVGRLLVLAAQTVAVRNTPGLDLRSELA